MKDLIRLALVLLAVPSIAFASNNPLQIVVDSNGCPTSVTSSDKSCNPARPDAPNVACRGTGVTVVWQSNGNPIESITRKSESRGELKPCNNNGKYKYRCKVSGKSGDHVAYNVKLQNCKTLDPTIIIK